MLKVNLKRKKLNLLLQLYILNQTTQTLHIIIISVISESQNFVTNHEGVVKYFHVLYAQKGTHLVSISSAPLPLYGVSVCMSSGHNAFHFLKRLIMVVSYTYSIITHQQQLQQQCVGFDQNCRNLLCILVNYATHSLLQKLPYLATSQLHH